MAPLGSAHDVHSRGSEAHSGQEAGPVLEGQACKLQAAGTWQATEDIVGRYRNSGAFGGRLVGDLGEASGEVQVVDHLAHCQSSSVGAAGGGSCLLGQGQVSQEALWSTGDTVAGYALAREDVDGVPVLEVAQIGLAHDDGARQAGLAPGWEAAHRDERTDGGEEAAAGTVVEVIGDDESQQSAVEEDWLAEVEEDAASATDRQL